VVSPHHIQRQCASVTLRKVGVHIELTFQLKYETRQRDSGSNEESVVPVGSLRLDLNN